MNLIERRRLLLEQCARSVEEQLKQEALNRSPENPIAALADYLGEPYNGLNPDQQRILLQIYMGIRLRESGIPDFQELDNKIAMESLRSAGIDV